MQTGKCRWCGLEFTFNDIDDLPGVMRTMIAHAEEVHEVPIPEEAQNATDEELVSVMTVILLEQLTAKAGMN